MERDLLPLLNRRVTFLIHGGHDLYGMPIETTLAVNARVNDSFPIQWNNKGDVVAYSGTIWCEVNPAVTAECRVRIGTTEARITSVQTVYDERGPHHLRVTFG